MSYTQATVIIAAADQAAAQVDFPGSFNSGFYVAVIAGKQASADEITNTETFINQRTGAY